MSTSLASWPNPQAPVLFKLGSVNRFGIFKSRIPTDGIGMPDARLELRIPNPGANFTSKAAPASSQAVLSAEGWLPASQRLAVRSQHATPPQVWQLYGQRRESMPKNEEHNPVSPKKKTVVNIGSFPETWSPKTLLEQAASSKATLSWLTPCQTRSWSYEATAMLARNEQTKASFSLAVPAKLVPHPVYKATIWACFKG